MIQQQVIWCEISFIQKMVTLNVSYASEFHWNFRDVVIDVSLCAGYGHYRTQATPL